MKDDHLNYASAGVDIDAADKAVEKIKKLARETFTDGVLSEIGSFGGFFRPDLSGLKKPVLISSADGVGTKLKIAFMLAKYDTVGEDLVNHCVNDILVHGARPLFFLDYIATGKLDPNVMTDIVAGFVRGCKNVGMALLGGEMAEMPDFYQPGEFDLAGFIVGLVDQDRIVSGADISEGDVIIGLASNGLHTNGYSLARKVAFEIGGLKATDHVDELRTSIGEALLKTHKSYLKAVHAVLEKNHVKGMAHITGGGLEGNLSRIIPDNLQAVINKSAWPKPAVFDFLRDKGNISEASMYEAFNMGLGFCLVVTEKMAKNVVKILQDSGEPSYIVGRVETGPNKVTLI
jgi:phosphoribosylformylglycinamidine cyclo-ligase